MLVFSRKLFSFDSLRYENMLLLRAKETSSLLLVLPIWLAGPISASRHKPTSYIILSEFHASYLVLFGEKIYHP